MLRWERPGKHHLNRFNCVPCVSTDQQAEKYGLGAQVTALQERVEQRGYTRVADGAADVFADDGFSGGTVDRPALTRLREAVRQGRVDVVLCVDPDRLSRALRDQLLLVDELEHAGVALEFLTQELNFSPEGRMFFAVRGAVAEFEKAKIRQRTMRGKQEKARRGLVVNPANLPKWLHWDATTQTVTLDPVWAALVQQVFAWYVDEGWTIRRVAQQLTALGHPTPTGGTYWQPTVVHHWLRNPAAAGTYYQLRMDPAAPEVPRKPASQRARPSARNGKALRPPDAWWPVAVPAVVDPDRWAAAQQRLDQNKSEARRNTRHAYLLRGLVVCGTCGARMAGYPPSPGRWRYRCGRLSTGARVGGSEPCPHPVSIDAPWLDGHVWARLVALLQQPALLAEALAQRDAAASPTRIAAETEVSQVQARLAALDQEMGRLVRGYRKGLIPDDQMAREKKGIQADQAMLTARADVLSGTLAQLTASDRAVAGATAFATRWADRLATVTAAEQALLLHRLVRRVVVEPGAVRIDTILPTEDPDPGDGPTGQTLCTIPQEHSRAPEGHWPASRPSGSAGDRDDSVR